MLATDIAAAIDRQLVDLAADRNRLLAARAVLLAGDGAPDPPPVRSRRRTRRPEAPPSFDVVPVGKLMALLRDAEDMSTGELATSTNGDPALIRELLAEQETAGEVLRSGSGASSRWHLVTDEDRIAARVAELEARSINA